MQQSVCNREHPLWSSQSQALCTHDCFKKDLLEPKSKGRGSRPRVCFLQHLWPVRGKGCAAWVFVVWDLAVDPAEGGAGLKTDGSGRQVGAASPRD